MDDEYIMSAAGNIANNHARSTFDEVNDLRRDAVDHVDLAALQRRHAGGVIVDDEDFDLVGKAAVVAPITGELFAAEPHTGFVYCDLVGAGTDACGWVVMAAIWLDH